MALIVDRMVRAARLDSGLYAEVERDEKATGQAIAVVLISAAAAGIGNAGLGGPFGLVLGALGMLVGWFVWAFLIHFIGTRLLPERETRADLDQVLRATGFAAAPGVIRVFGVVPLLGPLVDAVALVWMLAAFVVAVRLTLGYASTGRALAVTLLGLVVPLAAVGFLMVVGLGGAALLALL
jgi:hypothetical protein